MTAGAQSDYRFGFCDNTATLNDKMISTDGAMTVDAAIYFTPEDMARFAQGSITGVNVGIHSKYNTASIKAWLRDDISGQDIASNEVSSETDPALGTGWNSIRFDSPVAIEQGKGYYVGYTMTSPRPPTSSCCLRRKAPTPVPAGSGSAKANGKTCRKPTASSTWKPSSKATTFRRTTLSLRPRPSRTLTSSAVLRSQ